ncbi:transglycosylase SLT domain-containing protein [Thermomonas brevis]
MSFRSIAPLAAFLITVSAALAAPVAHAALPKREQAAVDALQARLDAAEKRYRNALLGEDDEAALAQADAAMGEIKAAIEACGKQRGCELAPMLERYEALLKATPGDDMLEDDEDLDLIDEADFASAGVPEQADAATLLGEEGERFVRMVQFNPAVQAGIRRWLTDMRPSLMDSYENFRYLQAQMSPSFKRHGLPEALLFGILAKESNGKVHVGSRAGAIGPMQFMPATGKRFGLGIDATGFDTRYDPQASADAAARYLVERMAQLDNSIELSLAGYNGGEGRALRVFRDFGGRSFWDPDVYNQFPAETKDYVPMVVAAAWLYLHPRDYGIHWPRVSTRASTIRLQQPANLHELTICLGNSGSRDGYMRTLRNLNPRWNVDSTMPAGTVLNATTRIGWLYGRYCTRGKRVELAQQLVKSTVRSALVRVGDVSTMPTTEAAATSAPAAPQPPSRPATPKSYTVQRGENLTGIARKFGCNVGELARANKLAAPKYAIRPGQSLKLDGCKG